MFKKKKSLTNPHESKYVHVCNHAHKAYPDAE